MKYLISKLLFLTGRFFPFFRSSSIESLKMRVYSGYISRGFAFFGKNSYISYSINALLNQSSIYIGDNCKIGKQAVLTVWDEKDKNAIRIHISNGVLLGDYIHISAINKVFIGDNVLTGRFVTIVDNSHGLTTFIDAIEPPLKRSLHSKGPVIIEKNVWIADKVTICPGVTIGEGAIIGSNSVVTSAIPPYTLAVGCPAKVVKSFK